MIEFDGLIKYKSFIKLEDSILESVTRELNNLSLCDHDIGLMFLFTGFFEKRHPIFIIQYSDNNGFIYNFYKGI